MQTYNMALLGVRGPKKNSSSRVVRREETGGKVGAFGYV